MGTRTATWGSNAAEKYFASPTSLGITLDAQEYPNGTISLNLQDSSPVRAWVNNGSSARTIKFYLCDSNGNDAIELFYVSFTAGIYMAYTPKSVTINNTSKLLKGKALYVKSVGIDTATSSSYIGTYGQITMTITTANAAVAVVKGNIIRATDRSQIGTSTTVGAKMTDSHFSSGTKAEASTFNSQVLGL